MTRLRLAFTLALSLTLLVGLVPSAEAAKRGQKCRSDRSTTVKKNRLVRVFEKDADEGTRLYGCLRRSGRKVLLAESSDDGLTTSQTYTAVRLAGRFVAWSFESTDISCKADCPPNYSGVTATIELYDLARRKSRSIAVPSQPLAKVLTKRGGMAWLQRATNTDGELEVVARDNGGTRVLDHGGAISRLKLRGSTVSWTKDGAPRSATLR